MITPTQIRSHVQEYLDGRISGADLVKCVDDAVSTDAVYDYSDALQKIIMRYQDLFSLYVDDGAKRLEHPSYYGPTELQVLVRDLGRELAGVDLGGEEGVAR